MWLFAHSNWFICKETSVHPVHWSQETQYLKFMAIGFLGAQNVSLFQCRAKSHKPNFYNYDTKTQGHSLKLKILQPLMLGILSALISWREYNLTFSNILNQMKFASNAIIIFKKTTYSHTYHTQSWKLHMLWDNQEADEGASRIQVLNVKDVGLQPKQCLKLHPKFRLCNF